MYARTPEEDLTAKQREATAVEMRLQGYEFEEIAIRCGYISSDGKPLRGSAYKAWQRAIRQVKPQTVLDARYAMQLRLNSYRKALAQTFSRENAARIVEVLTKVEEREAKLFGLDAIEDAALSNPPQIIISEAMANAIQGVTRTFIEGSADDSASAS